MLEGRFSLFSRYGYPLRVQGEQAYTSGSYCKAVKTAWSPRHPFRPYGKIRTANFIGDARKSAVLLRLIFALFALSIQSLMISVLIYLSLQKTILVLVRKTALRAFFPSVFHTASARHSAAMPSLRRA